MLALKQNNSVLIRYSDFVLRFVCYVIFKFQSYGRHFALIISVLRNVPSILPARCNLSVGIVRKYS